MLCSTHKPTLSHHITPSVATLCPQPLAAFLSQNLHDANTSYAGAMQLVYGPTSA